MSDEAAREGQVSIQCKRLEKAVEALREDIAHLEENLSPILSPSPPRGEEKEPNEVLVPHADFLARMAKKILETSEWIHALRGRIEL